MHVTYLDHNTFFPRPNHSTGMSSTSEKECQVGDLNSGKQIPPQGTQPAERLVRDQNTFIICIKKLSQS